MVELEKHFIVRTYEVKKFKIFTFLTDPINYV